MHVVYLLVKIDSVVLTCKECYFAHLLAANESEEYGCDHALTVNAHAVDCSHL